MDDNGSAGVFGNVLRGVADGAAEAIPGASAAVRNYKQIKKIGENIAGYNLNKARKAEAERMADAARERREEAAQAEDDRRQKAMIRKGHTDRIRQEKAERARASELMGVDVTNPEHYRLDTDSGISSSPETGTSPAPHDVFSSSQTKSNASSPTMKITFRKTGKGVSPTKVKFVMPKAPAAATPTARPSAPAKGGTSVPKAGFTIRRPGFARGRKGR